jgi:8-oxo-dGTP pyrophosphatase MutT (NUDIX family)
MPKASAQRRKPNKGKESLVAVLAVSTKKPDKVLLVTSRNSRSWALAKGHVERPLGAVESARREAFEEAGVTGRLATASIGSYIHRKSAGDSFRVRVFKMHVQEQFSSWPERKERHRRWVPVKAALKLVSNPSLRRFIKAQFNGGA